MAKVTDNFNLNFPARMSDGRQFTEYKSNCILNSDNTKTSVQYKNYLVNNATSIITSTNNHLKTLMECSNCSDYSIIPPQLSINCNKDNCLYDVINKDGVGI